MIFDKQNFRLLHRRAGRRIVYVIAKDDRRAWVSVFRANSGRWTKVQVVFVEELYPITKAEHRLVARAEAAKDSLQPILKEYR